MPTPPTDVLPGVPGWPELGGAGPDSGPVLPPVDVDLDALRGFVLPGPPVRRPLRWLPDARAHIQALAPEFGGQPAIDLLLAASIVCLRRDSTDAQALALFLRLLREEGGGFRTRLNLRWLRSVCDTLVDHGPTPEARAVAMCASTAVTLSVAQETERKLYTPRRPWPPRRAFGRGGALFDGLGTFHTETGDMIENFAARMHATAQLDPLAGPFALEVLARLRAADTALHRLDRIAGQPLVPVLPRAARRMLRWLTNRLL